MNLLMLLCCFRQEILQELTSVDLGEVLSGEGNGCHLPMQVARYHAWVMSINSLGESNYELHIPVSSLVPLYEKLMEAGNKGGHLLRNIGFRLARTLHAQASHCRWRADMCPLDTPCEAGWAAICSSEKQYLGSGVIAKQRAEKVSRRRIAIYTNDTRSVECRLKIKLYFVYPCMIGKKTFTSTSKIFCLI